MMALNMAQVKERKALESEHLNGKQSLQYVFTLLWITLLAILPAS